MPGPLATYVGDHLTGAKFAVQLLADLRDHAATEHVKKVAGELLAEIELDREQLQSFAEQIDGGATGVQEAAAWVVQKLSRFKLAPENALGVFEAMETLCLGILGKLALWTALKQVALDGEALAPRELDRLIQRATDQHARAEALRLQLAAAALQATAL